MAKLVKTIDYRTAFNDLGYEFRLNEVTRGVEVNGKQMDQYLEAKVFCNLREKGVTCRENAADEIKYTALDNRYHPIKEYLNSLSRKPGEKDYINELCSYFTTDKYFPIWLNRWLIAAVARVFQGAQCPVLILDGKQEIGKSKFAAWLCSSNKIREYFTEGPINPESKDTRIRATQSWIWEVPEFGATTKKSDIDLLKGFITLQHITERAPYSKQDEKRPMLACFMGTINNGHAGFLKDPTGNRRFLVTEIQEIDWKGYTEHCSPDNIWAQAVAAYFSGESFELTPNEKRFQEENNQNYEILDPLQAVLEKLYEFETIPTTFTPTGEIIEELQSSNYRTGSSRALAMELSETLAKLGIKKIRRRTSTSANPVWGYDGIRKYP
jgi:predicted P-loop ATPase